MPRAYSINRGGKRPGERSLKQKHIPKGINVMRKKRKTNITKRGRSKTEKDRIVSGAKRIVNVKEIVHPLKTGRRGGKRPERNTSTQFE